MDTLYKIILEIVMFFVSMVLWLALAWIPMLAWNIGVVNAFHTEPISYWTAYWLAIGLTFLTTKVAVVKSPSE